MKSVWQLFINFLRNLFNSKGNVSSKRFVGVSAFEVMVVMIFLEQVFHFKMNMTAFSILASTVVACFSLNTGLSLKALSVKENVATDVVDTQKVDANDDAKDILNADKP